MMLGDIAIDSAGNAYVAVSTAPGPVLGTVTKLNPSGSAVVYTTAIDGFPASIAVDGSGNASVTGQTFSMTFPTTVSAVQPTCTAAYCALGEGFMAKLNATGSGLLYSTYLGGVGGGDQGTGIVVDSSGNAYVTGSANSGFPTTASAYATSGPGAFVAKINPTLSGAASLLYSSFLGIGASYDIAIDSAGAAYITGETATATFPTKNAAQVSCSGSPCDDAFVAKFNPALSGANSLIYSTFLGGSAQDSGQNSAVDTAGRAVVVGETYSTNLITTTGAIQPSHHGGFLDGFMTKVSASGNTWVYSTYLGGSAADGAWGIALDPSDNAYVTGYTASTDFPTANAQQPTSSGSTDAFVTALRADGTGLLYSTYLGGSGGDNAWGIAVDPRGNAYVTGQTESTNFPLAAPVQNSYSGGDNDAFVTKLNGPARVTRYSYDGLLRLIGAAASPGNVYTYTDDLAGNRTSVQVNGGTAASTTYNAADQVTSAGYSYDLAGNLTSNGSATSTYDALSRTTAVTITATSQTRTNTYNGDGVLIKQIANGTTTDYTQDLAAPLAQVLQTKVGATTTSSLYGLERLASRSGAARTWYLGDALGSVRRTLSDSGAATTPVFYDPWGTPESGVVPTFGFTGELQDTAAGLVNLRARWYSTGKGTFTSRDPFAGFAEQPYSFNPYQYAYSDPILNIDPSGLVPPLPPGVGPRINCPIGLWDCEAVRNVSALKQAFLDSASRHNKTDTLDTNGFAALLAAVVVNERHIGRVNEQSTIYNRHYRKVFIS